MAIQMKAIEQYFMLYKVVSTFGSVGKIFQITILEATTI